MTTRRIQLTLFVSEDSVGEIETIRKTFNPVQYSLIRSHITLCRENELDQMDRIVHNLAHENFTPLTIEFGNVVRFSEGKGVLIPAKGNIDQFRNLRKRILKGVIENPGDHEPHITLMHPRNSTCTDEIFGQIERISLPQKIEFKKISLIEQLEHGKWNILKEFQLDKEKI